MKLSEAIRLGSMASEKCSRHIERPDGSRCALGAALFAVGESRRQDIWHLAIARLWPWTMEELEAGPDGFRFFIPIAIRDVIWHLNDTADWSREKIADWVATIEPQEPAPTKETVAPAVVTQP